MSDCHHIKWIPEVSLPLLALRPEAEMGIESVQTQVDLLRDHGHQPYVSIPGPT